jgi:hypothetical protein
MAEQLIAVLLERVRQREDDAAHLRPLVGQLVTCHYALTITGAIEAAETEARLLRDAVGLLTTNRELLAALKGARVALVAVSDVPLLKDAINAAIAQAEGQ